MNERWQSIGKIRSFFIGSSIIKTIKNSHIVIIAFLLFPLIVSVVFSLYNTLSYDRLITNVDKTNRLNQIVKTGISNELWDIVAGNKSFTSGRQYAIIEDINVQLNAIMATTTTIENQHLLEVAGRAMNTLARYVDRLGSQMENGFPVTENEAILDEIRGVSGLVSEILQDFIVLEIESAAAENEQIKHREYFVGIMEIVVIVLAAAFSVFVQISVSSNVNRSINSLVSLSGRIAVGDLDARAEPVRVEEFHTLTEDLNTLAGEIKTLIAANVEEQKNLQKSQMMALQAQITPHFLYNTLDSIVWLAEGNRYEEVISITRAFSDFFRLSLNQGREWVSVRDEFTHIKSYLTIQKIRYRDILDYSVDCEKEMEDHCILKLLLQPLVENALYHGIKNKRGRGIIRVKGWKESDFLCFRVEDNGIGMMPERIMELGRRFSGEAFPGEDNTDGYGLYNVSKRLELYYNRKDLLHIVSVYREGTAVTLKIPAAAEARNIAEALAAGRVLETSGV
ncbi:MAG: sensor histidine kinase [Treponema sp.]|nr:sensor histidine kinase [Treponema sp.]